MSQFKAGDVVRCINADPSLYRQMLPTKYTYSDDMSGLKEGEIYTVRNTDICVVGNQSEQVDLTGIRLVELTHGVFDIPFGATRFELVINE